VSLLRKGAITRKGFRPTKLIDSYGTEHYNSSAALTEVHPSVTLTSAIGQALPAYDKDYKLTKVKFYLRKFGYPEAVLRAGLWLSDGEKPTGAQLAISNSFNAEDLTDEFQLIEFTFPADQQYTMAKDTQYAVAVYIESATLLDSSNNYVDVEYEYETGSHAGITFYHWSGNWSAEAGSDTIFYLYGVED